MGLFKKLIKLLVRKPKRALLTQEEQDIVDQVVIVQPIIRDDVNK